jgi:hypothetical protein
MDVIHDAYVVFTERGWLPTLVGSCLLALVVATRRVPMAGAVIVLVAGLLVSIGWALLDLALHPEGHNLLPLELAFKLFLVAPLLIAVLAKRRRTNAVGR